MIFIAGQTCYSITYLHANVANTSSSIEPYRMIKGHEKVPQKPFQLGSSLFSSILLHFYKIRLKQNVISDHRKDRRDWGKKLRVYVLVMTDNLQNWELCLTIVSALIQTNLDLHHIKYQVTVLTYPSQTLSLPAHVSADTIKHRMSDFSSESLQAALKSQDLVISTTSGSDSELQIRIVDAAVAAGVKRFIPHEFGQDTLNKNIQARISKYGGRAEVLSHLRQIRESDPSFEWVAVATGYTLDRGLISGDLGLDMEWHSATIHGIGTESFAVSGLERVGLVILKVIQHWDQIKNSYIYAAGAITSANEILRSAERITGCEWTVGNYDVEDCVREGEARIKRGFPDAGMTLLERSVLYDEGLNACSPFQQQSSNDVLQLPSESIDKIVETAFHDLKRHGKPGCGCSS